MLSLTAQGLQPAFSMKLADEISEQAQTGLCAPATRNTRTPLASACHHSCQLLPTADSTDASKPHDRSQAQTPLPPQALPEAPLAVWHVLALQLCCSIGPAES